MRKVWDEFGAENRMGWLTDVAAELAAEDSEA